MSSTPLSRVDSAAQPSGVALPLNCSFTPSDWAILSSFWHPVAYSEEVRDKPVSATLLDEDLVIYRTTQGVMAAKNLCIHRGAQLSLGWIEGDELVCAYHGFRYNAEGACVAIPAHPHLPISKKLCLQVYSAVDRYGLIWVCLSREPRLELPAWPELENPAYHKIHLPPFAWKTSAARQTENFYDINHFSWVHNRSFGNREKPEIDKYEVIRSPSGLRMDYRYPAKTDGVEKEAQFNHVLTLPFSSKLQIPTFLPGKDYCVFVSACPVSSRLTKIFYWIALDDVFVNPQEMIDWETKVLLEDQLLVESQHPEELPLNLSEEFHIRADQMSTAYRKELAALGLGRDFSR